MTMKRREFLSRAAAGSAILTMPAFLQGCGTQLASIVSEPPPENPFLTYFNVDEAIVTQVMSALTSKGADVADAYFQHARSSNLSFADGAVGSAGSDIQQGVGLRVVTGNQAGFASTENLSLPAMLASAESAAAIATGTVEIAAPSLQFLPSGDLYPLWQSFRHLIWGECRIKSFSILDLLPTVCKRKSLLPDLPDNNQRK